jgi:hypothetical protein
LFCNVHHLQIRPYNTHAGGSSVAAQATNPNVYVTVEIKEPKTVDGGEPEEIATAPAPPQPKHTPGSVQVQQATKTVVDALVVYTPKAATVAGGLTAFTASVTANIARTNLAYTDSNIALEINVLSMKEVVTAQALLVA